MVFAEIMSFLGGVCLFCTASYPLPPAEKIQNIGLALMAWSLAFVVDALRQLLKKKSI